MFDYLIAGADVTVPADILGNVSVQRTAVYYEKSTTNSKIQVINLMAEEVR